MSQSYHDGGTEYKKSKKKKKKGKQASLNEAMNFDLADVPLPPMPGVPEKQSVVSESENKSLPIPLLTPEKVDIPQPVPHPSEIAIKLVSPVQVTASQSLDIFSDHSTEKSPAIAPSFSSPALCSKPASSTGSPVLSFPVGKKNEKPKGLLSFGKISQPDKKGKISFQIKTTKRLSVFSNESDEEEEELNTTPSKKFIPNSLEDEPLAKAKQAVETLLQKKETDNLVTSSTDQVKTRSPNSTSLSGLEKQEHRKTHHSRWGADNCTPTLSENDVPSHKDSPTVNPHASVLGDLKHKDNLCESRKSSVTPKSDTDHKYDKHSSRKEKRHKDYSDSDDSAEERLRHDSSGRKPQKKPYRVEETSPKRYSKTSKERSRDEVRRRRRHSSSEDSDDMDRKSSKKASRLSRKTSPSLERKRVSSDNRHRQRSRSRSRSPERRSSGRTDRKAKADVSREGSSESKNRRSRKHSSDYDSDEPVDKKTSRRHSTETHRDLKSHPTTKSSSPIRFSAEKTDDAVRLKDPHYKDSPHRSKHQLSPNHSKRRSSPEQSKPFYNKQDSRVGSRTSSRDSKLTKGPPRSPSRESMEQLNAQNVKSDYNKVKDTPPQKQLETDHSEKPHPKKERKDSSSDSEKDKAKISPLKIKSRTSSGSMEKLTTKKFVKSKSPDSSSESDSSESEDSSKESKKTSRKTKSKSPKRETSIPKITSGDVKSSSREKSAHSYERTKDRREKALSPDSQQLERDKLYSTQSESSKYEKVDDASSRADNYREQGGRYKSDVEYSDQQTNRFHQRNYSPRGTEYSKGYSGSEQRRDSDYYKARNYDSPAHYSSDQWTGLVAQNPANYRSKWDSPEDISYKERLADFQDSYDGQRRESPDRFDRFKGKYYESEKYDDRMYKQRSSGYPADANESRRMESPKRYGDWDRYDSRNMHREESSSKGESMRQFEAEKEIYTSMRGSSPSLNKSRSKSPRSHRGFQNEPYESEYDSYKNRSLAPDDNRNRSRTTNMSDEAEQFFGRQRESQRRTDDDRHDNYRPHQRYDQEYASEDWRRARERKFDKLDYETVNPDRHGFSERMPSSVSPSREPDHESRYQDTKFRSYDKDYTRHQKQSKNPEDFDISERKYIDLKGETEFHKEPFHSRFKEGTSSHKDQRRSTSPERRSLTHSIERKHSLEEVSPVSSPAHSDVTLSKRGNEHKKSISPSRDAKESKRYASPSRDERTTTKPLSPQKDREYPTRYSTSERSHNSRSPDQDTKDNKLTESSRDIRETPGRVSSFKDKKDIARYSLPPREGKGISKSVSHAKDAEEKTRYMAKSKDWRESRDHPPSEAKRYETSFSKWKPERERPEQFSPKGRMNTRRSISPSKDRKEDIMHRNPSEENTRAGNSSVEQRVSTRSSKQVEDKIDYSLHQILTGESTKPEAEQIESSKQSMSKQEDRESTKSISPSKDRREDSVQKKFSVESTKSEEPRESISFLHKQTLSTSSPSQEKREYTRQRTFSGDKHKITLSMSPSEKGNQSKRVGSPVRKPSEGESSLNKGTRFSSSDICVESSKSPTKDQSPSMKGKETRRKSRWSTFPMENPDKSIDSHLVSPSNNPTPVPGVPLATVSNNTLPIHLPTSAALPAPVPPPSIVPAPVPPPSIVPSPVPPPSIVPSPVPPPSIPPTTSLFPSLLPASLGSSLLLPSKLPSPLSLIGVPDTSKVVPKLVAAEAPQHSSKGQGSDTKLLSLSKPETFQAANTKDLIPPSAAVQSVPSAELAILPDSKSTNAEKNLQVTQSPISAAKARIQELSQTPGYLILKSRPKTIEPVPSSSSPVITQSNAPEKVILKAEPTSSNRPPHTSRRSRWEPNCPPVAPPISTHVPGNVVKKAEVPVNIDLPSIPLPPPNPVHLPTAIPVAHSNISAPLPATLPGHIAQTLPVHPYPHQPLGGTSISLTQNVNPQQSQGVGGKVSFSFMRSTPKTLANDPGQGKIIGGKLGLAKSLVKLPIAVEGNEEPTLPSTHPKFNPLGSSDTAKVSASTVGPQETVTKPNIPSAIPSEGTATTGYGSSLVEQSASKALNLQSTPAPVPSQTATPEKPARIHWLSSMSYALSVASENVEGEDGDSVESSDQSCSSPIVSSTNSGASQEISKGTSTSTSAMPLQAKEKIVTSSVPGTSSVENSPTVKTIPPKKRGFFNLPEKINFIPKSSNPSEIPQISQEEISTENKSDTSFWKPLGFKEVTPETSLSPDVTEKSGDESSTKDKEVNVCTADQSETESKCDNEQTGRRRSGRIRSLEEKKEKEKEDQGSKETPSKTKREREREERVKKREQEDRDRRGRRRYDDDPRSDDDHRRSDGDDRRRYSTRYRRDPEDDRSTERDRSRESRYRRRQELEQKEETKLPETEEKQEPLEKPEAVELVSFATSTESSPKLPTRPQLCDLKKERDESIYQSPGKLKSRWRRTSEMEGLAPVAGNTSVAGNTPPPPPPPPPGEPTSTAIDEHPAPPPHPIGLIQAVDAQQDPLAAVSTSADSCSDESFQVKQETPAVQEVHSSSEQMATTEIKSEVTVDMDVSEEIKEEIPEEKCPHFEHLDDNVYIGEKKRSKQMREVKRMLCDCTTCTEDREKGIVACGDDCLNRMLMIECGHRCPCGDYCTNKRFQRHEYLNVKPLKTETKGWGLFAGEDLEPGQFVMEYIGEVLDFKEFKSRTKTYAKTMQEHYYFMALNADEVIDATLKGNVSRFINHSCGPNCETQKWTVNGELRVGFFTREYIRQGEELTFDYQFERYGKEAQKCYCGSDNCRGFLGGTKSTPLKSKKRIAAEKKKKELFADQMLDEEIEEMVNLEGMKNKEHVLKLCRLMVRAESDDHRSAVLNILQSTKEAGCLRLFLDYHGLPLLWSWMADIGSSGSRSLKLQILQTLSSLPISNKTILKESKILSLVERWASEISTTDKEAESATMIDSSSSRVTDNSARGKTPVTNDDVKSNKKRVKFADETSSDSELSESSRVSSSQGNPDSVSKPSGILKYSGTIPGLSEKRSDSPLSDENAESVSTQEAKTVVPPGEQREITQSVSQAKADSSSEISENTSASESKVDNSVVPMETNTAELLNESESKEIPNTSQPEKVSEELEEKLETADCSDRQTDDNKLEITAPSEISENKIGSTSVEMSEKMDQSETTLESESKITLQSSEETVEKSSETEASPAEEISEKSDLKSLESDKLESETSDKVITLPDQSNESEADVADQSDPSKTDQSDAVKSGETVTVDQSNSSKSDQTESVKTVSDSSKSDQLDVSENLKKVDQSDPSISEESKSITEDNLETLPSENNLEKGAIENPTLCDVEDSSETVKPEHAESSKCEDNSQGDEIVSLATSLLQQWGELNELFKIPKKERVEERKRTERLLDRDQNYGRDRYDRKRRHDSPDRGYYKSSRSRYRSERRRDDYASDRVRPEKKRTLLPTPPKLSKEERRQLFEAQVKAKDEMAELERRQQQVIHQQQPPEPSYSMENYYSHTNYASAIQDPNFLAALEQDPSFVDAVRKDPGFMTALTSDPTCASLMQANPALATLLDPNYTGALQQDANYSTALQQDPAYAAQFAQDPNYAAHLAQNTNYAAQLAQDPSYAAHLTQDPNYAAHLAQDPNYAAHLAQDPRYAAQLAQDPNYAHSLAQDPTYGAQLTQDANYGAIQQDPAYASQLAAEQTYGAMSNYAITDSGYATVAHDPNFHAQQHEASYVSSTVPQNPVTQSSLDARIHAVTTARDTVLSLLVTPTIPAAANQVLPVAGTTAAQPLPQGQYQSQATPYQTTYIAADSSSAQNTTSYIPTQTQYIQGQPVQPGYFTGTTPGVVVQQAYATQATPSSTGQAVQGQPLQQPVQMHQQVVTAAVVEDVPPPPSPPRPKAIKLPPNWKTATDSEGKVYYYHSVTKQTQWEPPTWDTVEQDDMDLGTPTHDEPSSKSKRKATMAPADTSSEIAKRSKESFRNKMSKFIVTYLNPYRKPDCSKGRISSSDDFKHLARRLTHHVMAKELKHCRHPEDLEVNENVKAKAKDFVKKYMSKFGAVYIKSQSPTYFD